jgi:hypothetical protein
MQILKGMPLTQSTLPDTNTLQGARQAQLWLAKDGIKSTIWNRYDVWMLEAPDFPYAIFMNVPVCQKIS